MEMELPERPQTQARVPTLLPDPPSHRVYEVWQDLGGRNRFFCGGRCIAGPDMDYHFQLCTFCSLLVPSLFYFSVCARYLWDVSPWIPVLTAIMLMSTVALWFLTACTDPGIIPRAALQLEVPDIQLDVASVTGCRPIVPGDEDVLCDITAAEEAQGFRFCQTCRIIRPPRASHCRDCDNCVLRFDHHCPFVNNCIGQRNYPFFTAFLLSVAFLGLAVLSGIGLWYAHWTGAGDISDEGLMLLLLVLAPAVLLLPCVLIFVGFHTWLSCTGRTTKELLTQRREGVPAVGGPTLLEPRIPSLLPLWAPARPRDPECRV